MKRFSRPSGSSLSAGCIQYTPLRPEWVLRFPTHTHTLSNKLQLHTHTHVHLLATYYTTVQQQDRGANSQLSLTQAIQPTQTQTVPYRTRPVWQPTPTVRKCSVKSTWCVVVVCGVSDGVVRRMRKFRRHSRSPVALWLVRLTPLHIRTITHHHRFNGLLFCFCCFCSLWSVLSIRNDLVVVLSAVCVLTTF